MLCSFISYDKIVLSWKIIFQVSLVFLQWLPRFLGMHRPFTNPTKTSADIVRPSKRTQEGPSLRSTTNKGSEEKVEEVPQCPLNELMDTEPRLLLQTLLDWEDDYVPPPHVCHQKAENYFDRAAEEEVVNQMGGSNSVGWENPATFNIMRELGNILKVEIFTPTQKYHSLPFEIEKVELSIL